MKKSNVILYALLVVISVFLLWLWYFLGFNHVDNPLDLVLSIIWWVIVVVAIIVIVRLEKSRKKQIRTVYVANGQIFNAEAGQVELEDSSNLIDTVFQVLEDLKYNFSREDFPEKEDFEPQLFIRTSKIKDEDEWEGEVVNIRTEEEKEFKNRDELSQILLVQNAIPAQETVAAS